jgi:hypothetical protein
MTETIENLPVVSREPELIESMRGAKSGSYYSLDLVIPSREIHGDTKERIMRLGGSFKHLSSPDCKLLKLLVKKTTNRCRAQVLTNSDPRGMSGYLQHAQIPRFPQHLIPFTYLTNATITRLLKSR